MADRKNQHFVPRTLLRPWTAGAEDKSISLYNIRADRGVPNAPVKNQCSRDYFYGADLRIETWLGKGEGIYAETIRNLPTSDVSQTAACLEILRDFSYLQLVRTERSISEEAALLREMYDSVFHGALPEHEHIPDHEEIVREAVDRWRQTCVFLRDLKGVLVLNESNVPFVISDDPAVHTNRLHVQRLDSVNFGIQSSGMILTMPISPNSAVLFYDGAVYSVPSKIGLNVTISSDEEARSLNELQFIKANENVYFGGWGELETTRLGYSTVQNLRQAVHFRLNLLVPIEGKPGRFERAKDATAVPSGDSMIHLENVSFRPRRWPSLLRYKNAMHGFSDGSMLGFLRPQWAASQGQTSKNKVKF